MAVSSYDKQNLSTSQQKEIDRVTSSAKSGSMSWADAHSTAESIRNSAGYSGGRYGDSPTTVSNSGGGSSSGGGSNSDYVDSGLAPSFTQNTDYSQQIINMLTSGGSWSQDQLDALANARNSKMSADPTRYANVTSTADLVAKYLPQGIQNKVQTINKQQLQQAYPQAQSVENTQIQSLINLLQGLGTNGISRMSYADAQTQAANQLNPQYAQAATELSGALDLDMEKRGIYNSPLASGIMTEKQGKLADEKTAAIAQLASNIQQTNDAQSLQQAQLQSSTLNSLLSQLIGRQIDTAGLTGTLNGQNTLARDQYNTNTKISEGELTGKYNGQNTLAQNQYETNKSLSEAELTGKYNGQETLAAANQRISQALSSIQLLGKVTTQDQATLLGVPVGSPTETAKEAAAQLQETVRQFDADYKLRKAQLAASRAATAASNNAQKFSNAMAVWQSTGSAPAGILQQYGVTPGTPFSSEYSRSAQGKLDDLNAQIQTGQAEEELQFQNRATNFMKNYGVDRNTAEACLLTINNADNIPDAKKYLSANNATITSNGVSINKATDALEEYYNGMGKVQQIAPLDIPTMDDLLPSLSGLLK